MNNKEKNFSIFQGEKDGYPVYVTVDTTCKNLVYRIAAPVT